MFGDIDDFDPVAGRLPFPGFGLLVALSAHLVGTPAIVAHELKTARGRGLDFGLKVEWSWRIELAAGQVLRAMPCSAPFILGAVVYFLVQVLPPTKKSSLNTMESFCTLMSIFLFVWFGWPSSTVTLLVLTPVTL